mgnify:FL=1
MAIFDTHAHYVRNDFGEALHPLLSSMSAAGVEKIMAVGYDLESSKEEIQLAEQYPFIWAAVGIHPENCEGLPADWLAEVEEMLGSPCVKALGEIGLDRHYEGYDRDLQADVFEKQLRLAKKLDVPVIIHSRDACEDTMAMLRQYKPAGVMHCFSYSPEVAEEVVRLGMYVGFTGVLTFKNSKKAWAACEVVPKDRLLLETDCPYMAPVPHRGEKSHSGMIKYTAAKMAEIKGISTEEMVEICRENGERLFRI